jgi:penicillin V acylase-like amidase (Ntn superfamily)
MSVGAFDNITYSNYSSLDTDLSTYKSKVSTYESLTFTSSTATDGVNTYTVYLKKLMFSNNNYSNNAASGQLGVLAIRGA